MPPLNATLIRGCSELQGPATQEWLWHGSHFVAPSLCSLLGPITPHLSFLLSFFLELFWWGPADESPESEPRRGDGRTFSSSCGDWWSVGPTEGMEDAGSGAAPAPDGPGRRAELSPHRGARAHASFHIIYLAEDFLGVFFYLFYVLPVSPRCEPWDPRICFRIMLLTLSPFLHFFCQPCTLFALACYPLT